MSFHELVSAFGPTATVLVGAFALYGRLIKIEVGVTGLRDDQDRLEKRQDKLAEHSYDLGERVSKLEGNNR